MGPLDPLAPAIAHDAGQRSIDSIVSALPWPLSVIAGKLVGDRLEAVKAATRPNPYAAVPSGTQLTLATLQARREGLRSGFSGLAGSSARWDSDQDAPPGLVATGLRQDVTTAAIPPSRLIPWKDQRPRDENTTRGYTGPVITPGGSSAPRWGWSTRFAFPRIISGTLLPPEARTPTAREMARGYVDSNPSSLRLDDPYLVPDALVEDW